MDTSSLIVNALWITETQFLPFLLIFIRVSGVLFTAPLFGDRMIPVQVRIGLGLLIAMVLAPTLKAEQWPAAMPEPLILFFVASAELVVGLIVGFCTRLLFEGVQLAGQLIGYQMGFSMANVLDPVSGAQVSILGQLEVFLALFIFLSINAHHLLLRAMVESFRLIPPLGFQPRGILVERVMVLAGRIFILAIQIGAPVIAAILFSNVFLGIMARTMPQMNVFMVAMPIGIALGLVVLALSTPLLAQVLSQAFGSLDRSLMFLMKGM
ncbi:MAG: flagellar biosynthetic protein FliR [bacterium]